MLNDHDAQMPGADAASGVLQLGSAHRVCNSHLGTLVHLRGTGTGMTSAHTVYVHRRATRVSSHTGCCSNCHLDALGAVPLCSHHLNTVIVLRSNGDVWLGLFVLLAIVARSRHTSGRHAGRHGCFKFCKVPCLLGRRWEALSGGPRGVSSRTKFRLSKCFHAGGALSLTAALPRVCMLSAPCDTWGCMPVRSWEQQW
jgi:hypothetical protein